MCDVSALQRHLGSRRYSNADVIITQTYKAHQCVHSAVGDMSRTCLERTLTLEVKAVSFRRYAHDGVK